MIGRCAYHVFSLGWHDIAYNFLIDRFGTLRAAPAGHPGDLRRPQRVSTPTRAGWRSSASTIVRPQPGRPRVARHLLAWKLDLSHADPTGSSTVMSLGSAIYPFGDMVTLPNIAGHRDAQATSCPGDACCRCSPRSVKRSRSEGSQIYGGFPDIEPTPYREDMVFHLGFTERMIWSFRLSDNVDARRW